MQVGRVEEQVGLTRIGHMAPLQGVDLRQPVDVTDLEGVAGLQGKTDAAIGRLRAAVRGASQSGSWTRADLIDPSGRMDDRAAVRRRKRMPGIGCGMATIMCPARRSGSKRRGDRPDARRQPFRSRTTRPRQRRPRRSTNAATFHARQSCWTKAPPSLAIGLGLSDGSTHKWPREERISVWMRHD